jgi:hypothetical protein
VVEAGWQPPCDQIGQEDAVSNRTYGWVAGLIGAGFGAWWFRRMRTSSFPTVETFSDKGTVIFDNTPKPSEGEFAL